MIVFQNVGLIDIAAVTTMGVSVKGDGAIGYFGTGVKFAIATVLRLGGSITIWRGEERFSFTAEPLIVRGETFEQVHMNGMALGFTTALGRDWEAWMAFRELASNCRDEGGEYFRPGADGFVTLPDHTTVMVDGAKITDVWGERQTIMLEGEPLASNEVLEVRDGQTPFVFYRGVRIYRAPRPLAFTYNVLETVDLTEDRTARSWFGLETQMERGIGKLEDRALLRRVMTAGEIFQEHHMNVPLYGSPGPTFREMARDLALGPAQEKTLAPAISAFARNSALEDMREGEGVQLEPAQAIMLDKAKSMLAAGGFAVDAFPIIVCDTLGPSIHGLAKDGKIFLSVLPFAKGTREVAATLLEEFAHLKSGESDCTRGFQNWLFDQLLVQTERTAGEPF